ncbi:hypothetical protein ACFSZS_22810 [Seohaeicola zhoushanensis]
MSRPRPCCSRGSGIAPAAARRNGTARARAGCAARSFLLGSTANPATKASPNPFMDTAFLVTAFVTMFVVIDPPGWRRCSWC